MSKANKMKRKMALKVLSSDAVSVALGRTLGVSPKKARKLLAKSIIKAKHGEYEEPVRFHVNRGGKGRNGIFGDYDDSPKEDHSVEKMIDQLRKGR